MNTYEAMYMGALVALEVQSLKEASKLAELTRTDGEAWAAIAIMRRAPEGHRVPLALDWLHMRRWAGDEESP